MKPLLTPRRLGLVALAALTAGPVVIALRAPDAPSKLVDWMAAVGQIWGAIFAAAAAIAAWWAIRTTLDATRAQVHGQTVTMLLTRYADAETYEALQGFGRFAGSVVPVEDRQAIAAAVRSGAGSTRTRYRASLESPALQRVLALLHRKRPGAEVPEMRVQDGATAPDEEQARRLIAQRRLIHHHFKLVWSAYRAGTLSREHLPLVTTAHYGWTLWRDFVLPVTLGIADANGQPLPKQRSTDWDIEWPWELLDLVDRTPPLRPARTHRDD